MDITSSLATLKTENNSAVQHSEKEATLATTHQYIYKEKYERKMTSVNVNKKKEGMCTLHTQ